MNLIKIDLKVYSEHLAKCREYNKKRYYDTKQKLQRLKELEGELNKNV